MHITKRGDRRVGGWLAGIVWVNSILIALGTDRFSAGMNSSMAVGFNSMLYGWGEASRGRIIVGFDSVNRPLEIKDPSTGWEGVSIGNFHGLGLMSDGTLRSWGKNDEGQLGWSNSSWERVPGIVAAGSDWIDISAGGLHSLALKKNRTLWAWGGNSSGQLGNGRSGPRENVFRPVLITVDQDWQTISAGGSFSLAIKTNGTLWGWGSKLGPASGAGSAVPVRIGGESNWVAVAAGSYHAFALNKSGKLWAWGYNEYGQLGIGNTQDIFEPTPVPSEVPWSSIAAGGQHTLGLKVDGSLWSWGLNWYGQLGTGQNGNPPNRRDSIFNPLPDIPENRHEPVQVGTDTDWYAIDAGKYHSLALRVDGSLWAWGDNTWGQLGNGEDGQDFGQTTYAIENIPTQIMKLTRLEAIPRPEPKAVNFSNGWSMQVEVSANDGPVLRDVRLKDRYMAREISVPYGRIRTSGRGLTKIELTPDIAGDSRARLIEFSIEETDNVGTIHAKYYVDDISASALFVECNFRFEPYREYTTVGDQIVMHPFTPEVTYHFLGRNNETLIHFTAVLRIVPEVDGVSPGPPAHCSDIAVLLAKDSLTGVVPQDGINPTEFEHYVQAIQGGKEVSVHNFHQTWERHIETPFEFSNGKINLVGCPECFHMHWFWHPSISGFVRWNGVPFDRGSLQDMDIAVVNDRDDERDIWEPASLADGERLRNPAVYLIARSGGITDQFFTHGGFFMPTLEASKWAITTRANVLEITPLLSVDATPPLLDRSTGRYRQHVNLTNKSKSIVRGPMRFIPLGLKKGNDNYTFVRNGDGLVTTITGEALTYLNIPAMRLDPGESTTIVVELEARGPLHYLDYQPVIATGTGSSFTPESVLYPKIADPWCGVKSTF